MTNQWRMTVGAILLAGAVALVVACNSGGTVSGPEPVNQPAPAPAVAAEGTPATPTPVADPTTTPDHECSVGKNASFSIKNTSTILQQYVAWWTDFDDQTTVRGTHGPFQFRPGDSMTGSFDRQCVQVDVGQTVNGTPYCFGFIDKEGNPFVPSRAPDKVAACRTKPCVEKWILEEETDVKYGEWSECTPEQVDSDVPVCSKSRKVTTTYYERNSCTQETRVARTAESTQKSECECPCVEQWIAGDPVRENESAYGICEKGGVELDTVTQINCDGHKTRTVDIVIYETSSCTEETRELSRKTIDEQAECNWCSEQPVCHTQNDKWCIPGDGCFNFWLPGTVKKYQCQNVPPGTPGHFPNHFPPDNNHADFFGLCGPVGGTSDLCYSIVN